MNPLDAVKHSVKWVNRLITNILSFSINDKTILYPYTVKHRIKYIKLLIISSLTLTTKEPNFP